MNSYYDCLHNESKYGYEKEYFWVSGICLVVVGMFGLFGNLTNFIILWQGNLRKNSFYQLLNALAFFDICFIVSFGIRDGYQALACEPQNEYVSHFTYQALNIALTGSTYMTIAISLERYLGICRPRWKTRRGAWRYVLPVVIITVSYNLPRFFERQYFIVNGTLESNTTEFSHSESYKFGYHFLASTIINTLIPMASLVVLNGAIIATITRNSRQLQEVVGCDSHRRKNMTNILFSIVTCFIIFHLPRVIYKSLYYFGNSDDAFRRKWWFIVPIKKLTLMMNSSINFVIYCLLGKTFRNELYRFLRLSRYVSKENIRI